MDKVKTVQIFPTLFKKDLGFKTPTIIWERGKGVRIEEEEFIFEFPPKLLTLHFHSEEKD